MWRIACKMAVRFISKSPQTLKPPQSLGLVTIVITINVVIGAFSREHLKLLAHVTVRLRVSNYSQLSDYSFAD